MLVQKYKNNVKFRPMVVLRGQCLTPTAGCTRLGTFLKNTRGLAPGEIRYQNISENCLSKK